MSNIIGQIISISRGIGRRRRFLKNRDMSNAKIEKYWQTTQLDLRVALINSFQLQESDVVNFPQFLETNFDDLIKKLTPDIIQDLSIIIVKMRHIESFLSGMMAGFDTHRKTLGNYSGIIYDNYGDSPVGGEYDDCDMIVVANSNVSWRIQNYANRESVITKNVSSYVSKRLGLNGNVNVISICH